MVSKSITSPIDITKVLGGINNATVATSLFSILTIKHDISEGLSLGFVSHEIGT
jgi:putative effector of murein hydrolase